MADLIDWDRAVATLDENKRLKAELEQARRLYDDYADKTATLVLERAKLTARIAEHLEPPFERFKIRAARLAANVTANKTTANNDAVIALSANLARAALSALPITL